MWNNNEENGRRACTNGHLTTIAIEPSGEMVYNKVPGINTIYKRKYLMLNYKKDK